MVVGDNLNLRKGQQQDHSNLTRFQPRHAAKAALSNKQHYRNQMKLVRKNVHRRKLPRTQQGFYQDMR
jgi:hypothetical protein